MNELLATLAAHRRRVRIERAAETAVRWAFHAAVLACVFMAASKILGLTISRSVAVTLLVAIPLSMAAREWVRSFSVRDCAIHLDRVLGLEERLATAVEAAGPMAGVQAQDAAGALRSAPPLPRRLPRETRLLAAALILLAALIVAPAPSRSGASADPALEAAARTEADKLEAIGAADPEIARAVALLRLGRTEEALALLQSIRERLAERALESGTSGGAAKAALEAVSAGVAALSAELARAGRVVHAPVPAAASRKLERQADAAASGSPALADEGGPLPRASAGTLARRDWPERYHGIVKAYFGGKP